MKRSLATILVFAMVAVAHAQKPEDCQGNLASPTTVWGVFKSILRELFRPDQVLAEARLQAAPSYMASNPPRLEAARGEGRVEVRFKSPSLVYFREHTYESLNAEISYFSNEPASTVELPRRSIDRTKPYLEVERSKAREHLPIPEGYVAVAIEGGRGFAAKFGTALRFESDRVYVELEAREEILDPSQKRTLTTIYKSPALTEYPRSIQDLITRLLDLKRLGLITNGEIIDRVDAFLRGNFRYVDDGDGRSGVLAFCRLGQTQCAGAAAVFVTLLRAHFDIPCIAVSGFRSEPDEQDGTIQVIRNGKTRHMWVKAWDNSLGRFRLVDPTPPGEDQGNGGEVNSETEIVRNWEEDVARVPNLDPTPRRTPSVPREPSSREERLRSLRASLRSMNIDDSMLKSARERREEQQIANWRVLFDPEVGTAWTQKLEELRSESSYGPDASAATRILDLVTNLPSRSLAEHIASLDHTPRSNDEAKKFWFTIAMLKTLAPFGMIHSGKSKAWARLDARIAQFDGLADEPGDRAAALRQTMPGPFSRRHFDERWLRVFLQIRELHDRISLARIETYRATPLSRHVTSLVPTDSDPDFDTAEDFDALEYFERGGLPPKYDALRVMNGDMLRRVWTEDQPLPDSPPLRGYDESGGPEVTVILYDRSGSMEGLEEQFRDRLVQTWIDELAHQKVILLGFKDEPDEEELVLESEADHDLQFRKMIVDDGYFESDDGTDIQKAFERAIEILGKLGRHHTGVNLRIITDGGAPLTLEKLRAAKAQLGSDVTINITGVTLNKGSRELHDFLEEGARAGLLGDKLSVHFDLAEMREIMSVRRGLERWFEGEELPKNFRQLRNLPESTWDQMTEIATEIAGSK